MADNPDKRQGNGEGVRLRRGGFCIAIPDGPTPPRENDNDNKGEGHDAA